MANTTVDYPYDRPFPNRPQQIITYPYPPIVQMENGEYYAMPDMYTLVQLVYSLRDRINVLENGGKNDELS